jgi:WD40 repeat protein
VVAPVDRAGFERGQASRMALIAALVNSHMLTSEAVGTAVLVRPVHDALLRTWPLASRLIAEHAPFIHMRHTLAPMVEGWHKAGHRDKPEHLATGAFLAGAVALQSKMADVLDADMLAFIEASRAAHSRRRRVRSASLVAGLVVAVGLLQLFSIMQTRDAQAGRLVAEAKGALSQMEHARAEIAAAGALRLRSDKETRQLLLAARLGGVSIVARAAEPVPTTLTVFNPSARLVASVEQVADGQQQAVRVASVTDGRTLWRLPLPAGVRSVDAVAFGPDLGGERPLAVSWSVDGAAGYHVGLWALRDGQNAGLLRELPTDAANGGHTKRIPGLAFHPAQVWLATGGEDGKLALWDVSGAAGRLLWQRERTHEPNIHGIAFSRDGRLLASAGGDYLARVWETAALVDAGIPTAAGAGHKRVAAKYTLSGHRDSVFAVAFNPEGTRLATGGYDRTVRVWDFALATTAAGSGGQPPTIATLSDHDGTIFSIAYSDDGRLLASGASDGSAALWDASTGRLLNRIRPDDGIVRSVSLPRFEGGLHVGGEQGWSVWSVSGNAVIKRLWNGGATVNNVAFDATGKFLAAAGDGDEGRVRVWDASFGAPRVLDPKTEGESINGLAFSPDARWLVAGGSKMQLHVWDRTQRDWPRRAFAEAPSHRDIIWGLCFDAQSRWLASSSQSPGVQIKRWDTQTWRLLDETPPNELQDSIWAIACDGVGNRLISGDSKEVIVVRDANDLQIVDMAPPRHTGELNVWSVAVMQSPHAILSAHADGRVRKWTPMKDAGWRGGLPALDASTTAQAAKVNPTVNSISHDPRHGWVAAGGVGPSVEIYDDKTLTLQRSLRGHSGTIWWVTFNNQGTKLAYGGLDGIVRVVDLDNMLKIDDDKPAALYEASQRATGLTVVDDAIVRSRVGGGASGGSPW